MSIKSLIFMTLISLMSTNGVKKAPANESITISGNISMVDINQYIVVNLDMVEGHPYAYIMVKIYVDDVLEIERRAITKYLNIEVFRLNPFSKRNQKKKIEISVNYVEENVEASIVSFDIYSPHNQTYESNEIDTLFNLESYPVKVDFQMKGQDAKITNTYESFRLSGEGHYVMQNTRFFNFSSFYLMTQNINQKINKCEFQLKATFPKTDLLKKNEYYYFSVNLEELSEGIYNLKNDYMFYINRNSGMIYRAKTMYCDDEVLPFFIPYSMGNEVLFEYKIIFNNVGINKNNYIFNGEVYVYSTRNDNENMFGGILNYQYIKMTPLKEVEYA